MTTQTKEKPNILFGEIIVEENGKKVNIPKAVFIEGSEFYKTHTEKKPARKIVKIVSSKIIGKVTNE